MQYLLISAVVGTLHEMHIQLRSYYRNRVTAPDMRWIMEVTWKDLCELTNEHK